MVKLMVKHTSSSMCTAAVASVYQGNCTHQAQEQTRQQHAAQEVWQVLDRLHTLLCTLWPRSAQYASMEHAAVAVQVDGLLVRQAPTERADKPMAQQR